MRDRFTVIQNYSSLVQSVERWTVNPYVAGSSPAGGANFSFGLEFVCLLLRILN